jgi:hypothetical protein
MVILEAGRIHVLRLVPEAHYHLLTPLPQGGEGKVDFLALALLGWLDEAFSPAEARRGPHALLVVGVRGSRPVCKI